LADNVVIVDAGRVIAEGSPAEIIAGLHADSIVELFPKDGTGDLLSAESLRSLPGVAEARREGASFTLVVTDTQESIGALLRHLDEVGVKLQSLQTHSPTLEDVFVALTGKHLRDGE